MKPARKLELSVIERAELARRVANSRAPQVARRARVILLLSHGATWREVMQTLRCSRGFVARWLQRFRAARLQGLRARHLGRRPALFDARREASIVRASAQRNAQGGPRWSTRTLARELGVSHMTIQRLWERHGVERGAGPS